ncbi:DoxX family protein [Paenibacillus sepulcri]|uniref:DoxX family protein n=1 Tax=Paenibacillus sepulcri TaxID=359917 RepID=A0ABS7C2H5_9BACL|nr:DoxX family protein [Paenibacillus sepulcri]
MDVLVMIIEILLGLMFLMAGSMKVFGTKMQVDSFAHLKLPQWFRVFTGLTQYIAVIALVIGFWEPSWSAWAGIWLGFIMLGAAAAHIRVKDPVTALLPVIVLLILSVALTLLQSSELANFPG